MGQSHAIALLSVCSVYARGTRIVAWISVLPLKVSGDHADRNSMGIRATIIVIASATILLANTTTASADRYENLSREMTPAAVHLLDEYRGGGSKISSAKAFMAKSCPWGKGKSKRVSKDCLRKAKKSLPKRLGKNCKQNKHYIKCKTKHSTRVWPKTIRGMKVSLSLEAKQEPWMRCSHRFVSMNTSCADALTITRSMWDSMHGRDSTGYSQDVGKYTCELVEGYKPSPSNRIFQTATTRIPGVVLCKNGNQRVAFGWHADDHF